MTIRIYRDRIELGDFVLRETADGASFDGEVAAQQFLGTGFQGSISGYTSGGNNVNTIDKFPFAADTNATDVGDSTIIRYNGVGQSSQTYGYLSGTYPNDDTIDKFPFASDTNATDVGNLSVARHSAAGQSSTSFGYTSGGDDPTASPNRIDTIDKFPFAADNNATDVGNLSLGRVGGEGQSSSTHGYTSGGLGSVAPTTMVDNIDKFPFAADTNATDVGNLSQARREGGGQSSTTHGYVSGGSANPWPGTRVNTIDKFPFASNSNASDVGDLYIDLQFTTGQSSTSFGYQSGGSAPTSNVIQKFPFATDSNSTDVGDLTQGRYFPAGQQY